MKRRRRAVGRLDPRDATGIARLQEALLGDPDAETRASAARQLGIAGVAAGVPILVDALADPDPRVIESVLRSLVYLGDFSAGVHVEPLRWHADPKVRDRARRALRHWEQKASASSG